MLKSLLILPLAFVAAASTFPLEVGNSWTYRDLSPRFASSEDRSIEVQRKVTVGNREYFETEYFGKKLLLRANPDGSIVSADPTSGAETPWLSLGAPEGSSFPAHPDSCTNTGTIVSRKAERTTPAGSFTGLVQIAFRGNCADAGTTEQLWAENVGLVSHEETSFAGPRRFLLVAFRPAGVAAPEVAFTMGLDRRIYAAGATLEVRLTLANSLGDPIPLTFPSGQSYDLKLFDQTGKLVYTWSDGRAFTMIYRQESFGPGTPDV